MASDLRNLRRHQAVVRTQLPVAEQQVNSTNLRISPIMLEVPTPVAQMSQLFNRARALPRMATISKWLLE